MRPRRAKTLSGPGIWYAPRRVTHFRFRCFAQTRHGLHGGESPRCCVSAAAAGSFLATGQVFGASAHLQRAREPATHRVAAGEELLREVEEASRALPASGCAAAVGRARRPTEARPRLPPEPARGFPQRGRPWRTVLRLSPVRLSFPPRSLARSAFH